MSRTAAPTGQLALFEAEPAPSCEAPCRGTPAAVTAGSASAPLIPADAEQQAVLEQIQQALLQGAVLAARRSLGSD